MCVQERGRRERETHTRVSFHIFPTYLVLIMHPHALLCPILPSLFPHQPASPLFRFIPPPIIFLFLHITCGLAWGSGLVGTTDSKRQRMNGGPTTVRPKGKRRTGQKTHSVWFSWTGQGTTAGWKSSGCLRTGRSPARDSTPGEGMSHKA